MKFFSTFVGTTAFKYLVAMVATYVASKMGIDQGSIEAILTQLIGVAMLAWGAWESSRNKVVIDGKKVLLPSHVNTTAERAKDDILIGRVGY